MPPLKPEINTNHSFAIHKAILYAGGQKCMAKILGVTQPNINYWLYGKSLIPLKHAETLEALYGPKITVLMLRPDIAKYSKYFGIDLDIISKTL